MKPIKVFIHKIEYVRDNPIKSVKCKSYFFENPEKFFFHIHDY